MNGTSPADVRKQIERRWKSGELLRALVCKAGAFPLRLKLKVPSSREIAESFGEAQKWLDTLSSLRGLRIEWGQVRSRLLGSQPLPEALWIDTAMDAVAHLGFQSEAEDFLRLHNDTCRELPLVTAWVEANPHRALSCAEEWGRLLQVVAWKHEHPDLPPMYVRQVDLPNIDTKLIERNASILSELFDLVLPPVSSSSRDNDFRRRHGFLREPVRIRFRILDSEIDFAGLSGSLDIEIDEDSFASLHLPLKRVFATENKTNFLAFPRVRGAIIVFTAGYGMRAFGRADWVRHLPLYYWGDIDTHGYAILSQLREFFPHTRSFLMDEQTLLRHRSSWTEELVPVRRRVEGLSLEEAEVFDKLLHRDSLRGVRLEQEKIPIGDVYAMIDRLLAEET